MSDADNASATPTSPTIDEHGSVVNNAPGNTGNLLQAHTITGSVTIGGITIGGAED